MAELIAPISGSISARQQLAAIAWLRWRVFANSFQRRALEPGRIPALLFVILLRILFYPVIALFFAGPIAASGLLAYSCVQRGSVTLLTIFLAGAFMAWQYISVYGISLAASTANFDPAALIRFPIPFRRYVGIRLLIGLLSPSSVVGSLAMLAAAIGIALARHGLLVPALIFMALYALMNILFTRMTAAWVERWLATRRARDIFSAVFVLLFVAVQVVNLQGRRSGVPGRGWLLLLRRFEPALHWLPPGLAANGIFFGAAGSLRTWADAAAIVCCSAIFLVAFAARLRRQYLGEDLSEGASKRVVQTASTRVPLANVEANVKAGWDLRSSQVFLACLKKEWLYLRTNNRQWLGVFTTLTLVFVLSSPRGVLGMHPSYELQGAIAYVLFGPLSALFNVFGADAAGFQFYLLAPARMRDVLLAKNIANLIVLSVEIVLTWALVLFRTARTTHPIPAATQAGAAFWTIFILFVALGLGSLRSIQAPRRYVPGQSRRANVPTSQTSLLIILGVVLASFLLQIPVTMLARRLGEPWLASAIFAPLAAVAVLGYLLVLKHADGLVLKHRETLAKALCRSA